MSATTPHADFASETVLMSPGEIRHLSQSALLNNGFDEANATAITDTVVACELSGSPGHGLIRVPNYIRGVLSGRISPKAKPVLKDAGPAQVVIDGQNGYAALAIDMAREAIMAKAETTGVAIASFRDTHHMHALWWDLEPFAERGMVALEVISTRQAVAIYDSKKAVLGTNPLGASFPRRNGVPITIDMATSKVSRGDIRRAAHAGTLIPLDWGLDEDGEPTSDASRIFPHGAQLPFSAHPKASNIALLVELLATVLSGDRFGFEAAPEAAGDDAPIRTGTGIIVFDPERLGIPDFAVRTDSFVDYLIAMGCERMPGGRRQEQFLTNRDIGVSVPSALIAEIRALAGLKS